LLFIVVVVVSAAAAALLTKLQWNLEVPLRNKSTPIEDASSWLKYFNENYFFKSAI
jgi:archaellum component FlaG (FlaF/FlaG flagellin family)